MRTVLMTVAFLLLTTRIAYNQENRCNPSDFRDTYKKALTLRQTIAFFKSFSEENLKNMQKGLDVDAKIPITDSFSIDSKTKWSDVQNEKTAVSSIFKFDSSYNISSDVYQSYLSPLYSECLKKINENGLRAWVEEGSPGSADVSLRVSFLAPQQQNQKLRFDIQVIENAVLTNQKNPEKNHPSFTDQSNQVFVLTRDNVDKISKVIVYVRNEVTHQFPAPITIIIPPRPRLLQNKPVYKPLKERSHYYSHFGHDDEHPFCASPSVAEGYSIDDSLPFKVFFDELNGAVNSFSISIVSQSKQSVCAHAKLYADNGNDAAGFGNIEGLQVIDPNWVDVTNDIADGDTYVIAKK